MTPENQLPKSSWNITRIGLIGSAIILAAAIAYTFYHESSSEQSAMQPTIRSAAGQPIPANNAPAAVNPAAPAAPAPLPKDVMQASISLIDGGKKKLSDYSGKVLVVDLWATWCGPCRKEIPHLVEIAKEYKSKGVEVIGLTNEDPQMFAEHVKKFSKAFNINYPIGWADEPMQFGITQGRQGIPQTIIIGRDGKVLNHFVGFNEFISPPQMKKALEAAVGEG
jgi:thiol-disulfide isomerase/thioredoxin